VTDTVLLEVRDAVATVTLNRPHRLNAFGDDLIDRLLATLQAVGSDDDVAAVILTGAGRGFCPGADFELLTGERDPDAPPEPHLSRVLGMRVMTHVTELLREMPKVTIAAVNGACAGAGLSLALACDLRLAARSAVFRTAFLGVGASGDYGVNWTLPRVVGWGKARELLFLNEKIRPDEARDIGLVARVYDDDQLMDEARAIAARLVALPRAGLVGMKQNLLESERASLADMLTREADRLLGALGSPEAKAAARSVEGGAR